MGVCNIAPDAVGPLHTVKDIQRACATPVRSTSFVRCN